MLIKTGKDRFENLEYDFAEKNQGIMNSDNYKDLFNFDASYDSDSDKVSEFMDKLIKFIRAEKSDWGNKEIYLSFDDIEYLVTSAKILHDRYAAGRF